MLFHQFGIPHKIHPRNILELKNDNRLNSNLYLKWFLEFLHDENLTKTKKPQPWSEWSDHRTKRCMISKGRQKLDKFLRRNELWCSDRKLNKQVQKARINSRKIKWRSIQQCDCQIQDWIWHNIYWLSYRYQGHWPPVSCTKLWPAWEVESRCSKPLENSQPITIIRFQ